VRRYGVSAKVLPALRLTDRDFIIDIPPAPLEVPTYGVTAEKFEGKDERPRPVIVRVTVHLKNISLRLWFTVIDWGAIDSPAPLENDY
jgi:hypothetical protein